MDDYRGGTLQDPGMKRLTVRWSTLTMSGHMYYFEISITYTWILHILGIIIYMDLTRIRYTRWQGLSLVHNKAGYLFV